MMGTEAKEATSERREAITDAATGVFLRYGYKKTSMDDLARAAGLSRQGLYLHFKTKEALFTAALLRLASQIRAAARAAIDRDDLDLEERLLGAFEAFQGHAIGTAGSQSINELLETAASLGGRLVHEMEQDLVNSFADLLTRTGVATGWKEAGISAHDLAEHLYATSTGLTHTATTPTTYRTRMRIAVKIVTSGTHT